MAGGVEETVKLKLNQIARELRETDAEDSLAYLYGLYRYEAVRQEYSDRYELPSARQAQENLGGHPQGNIHRADRRAKIVSTIFCAMFGLLLITFIVIFRAPDWVHSLITYFDLAVVLLLFLWMAPLFWMRRRRRQMRRHNTA